MTSFTSGCPQTDRSLNSYFKERSNKMGLLSSKLSPGQRVGVQRVAWFIISCNKVCSASLVSCIL